MNYVKKSYPNLNPKTSDRPKLGAKRGVECRPGNTRKFLMQTTYLVW